jgi:hypothetical protein
MQIVGFSHDWLLQTAWLKLARNSEALFSWMPAYAGMTSFPRKRESSRS